MEKLCHGVSIQTTDMAEINVAAAGARPGVRRAKKLSTRVDLTPMVDLGFLLITFFVFTTTMSEPVALNLVNPKDSTDSLKTPLSTALTVFPLSNGKVFYYLGQFEEAKAAGTYGLTTYHVADGLGKVIREKQAAMNRKKKDFSKELFLIIKPTNETSYRQLIQTVDEVLINVLEHYAISDITEREKELILQLNGSL